MPTTEVLFYKDDDGRIPILDWLDGLSERTRFKCLSHISLLEDFGHELRRPQSDYLRDDIYELRPSVGRVNYRMLYFFSGRNLVVISHGVVKKRKVPHKEIELAIERKLRFENDPETHSFRGGY